MSSPFRAAGARAERPCLDAGDRRQRAREGGAADPAARRAACGAASSSPRRRRSCARSVGDAPGAEDALTRALAVDPPAAEMIEPLLRSRCRRRWSGVAQAERHPGALRGDGRLPYPPGQSQDEVEAAVASALGDATTTSTGSRAGGTRSPMEGRSGTRSRRFVAESEPGAQRGAAVVPGFTDSHWLRRRSARSRTASSRCGRWTRRRPRG